MNRYLIHTLKPLLRCFGTMELEYLPQRTRLCRAGLSEQQLRRMTPDDRVATLEAASLDPYDYIFLAC